MRIPTIQGLIKRRILANFRADPEVVQRILPPQFRPKLHDGHAIVGVCLIRLEQIRPVGLPPFLGIASENAAHRISVQWLDESGALREGVFIARRDTGSILNHLAGGTLFPGEHHRADFTVTDDGASLDFRMTSQDHSANVELRGHDAETLPATSSFRSVAETSAFFEAGSLGYSVTKRGRHLDGLTLKTTQWRVAPLAVSEINATWFQDEKRFPKGAIAFDHALIMRNIPHEWHAAADFVFKP